MTGFLDQYDGAADADKLKVLFGAIRRDPDGLFTELRARRPILLTPPPQVFAVVTHMRDVQEVLSQWTVFTVRHYARAMDPSVGPFMLARDDTEINQRDKSIMLTVMARADAPTVRDVVARLTRRALDALGGQSTFEVVEAVSRRVPIEFCGAHFGFPGPDRQTMARWSRATQHDMFYNLFADTAIHDANVQAGTEMRAYLKRLIGQRHRQLAGNPALDDTLSRLLKLSPPPSIGFDRERIVSNVMGLLVGMVETTSAAVVQALDQLLARPNELQAATEAALADDDATVAAYVWEALRFFPINAFAGRVCVAPYTLAGGSDHATEVPAGAFMLVAGRSAMRDERAIADPETFRADRPSHHTIHFGHGPHTCLGSQINLVQVPEIVKHLLRLPGLKRADGPAGELDFQGGPFPERFSVGYAAPAVAC